MHAAEGRRRRTVDADVDELARTYAREGGFAGAAGLYRSALAEGDELRALPPLTMPVLAVGGGSAIDTAKAVNLLTSNPGELMDYINAPVGRARAPKHPLKPLVAVPTTTGTGSESTTICVLDVLSLKVKTGISHPRLRPTLAVVDPRLTMTQPAGVTAAAGMDILCHALESYTARWYTTYDRQAPEQRVYHV